MDGTSIIGPAVMVWSVSTLGVSALGWNAVLGVVVGLGTLLGPEGVGPILTGLVGGGCGLVFLGTVLLVKLLMLSFRGGGWCVVGVGGVLSVA